MYKYKISDIFEMTKFLQTFFADNEHFVRVR